MFRPCPLPPSIPLPCTPDPALPGWEATAPLAVLAIVLILVRGGYSPLDAVTVAVLAGVDAGTVTSRLRAVRWRGVRGAASA